MDVYNTPALLSASCIHGYTDHLAAEFITAMVKAILPCTISQEENSIYNDFQLKRKQERKSLHVKKSSVCKAYISSS